MNTGIRNIYDLFKKNVFFFTITASLSTIYFPIFNIWGTQLGLKDESGTTIVGFIVTIMILSISFLIILFRALADRYDSKLHSNAFEIMDKLLRTANSLRDVKYQYYKNMTGKQNEALCDNYGSEQQVFKSILSFRDSIADLIGISDEDIGISVIYRTNTSDKYRIINTPNIEDDIDVNEILQVENSTIGFLIKNKRSIVFVADKRIGRLRGRYIVSPKDAENKYIGSIVCKNISLKQNGELIVEAYLTITTYGYQICDEQDYESKKKFAKYFMPILVKAIKLEFSKKYLVKYSKCPYRETAKKQGVTI